MQAKDLLGSAASDMNEQVTYHIEVARNGNQILVRNDGAAITPEERDTIISAVKFAARLRYAEAMSKRASDIAREIEWLFPDGNEDATGVQKCVYFVADEAYPGLIKIGKTNGSVRGRIGHLRTQAGCTDPQLIAVAPYAWPGKFEQALHGHFDQHRVTGEWFRGKPVLDWLISFGGES